MVLSVSDIARMIGAEIHGDQSLTISGVNSFKDAVKSEITFADDAKFARRIKTCQAGAVIVSETLFKSGSTQSESDQTLLIVNDPRRAFFNIVAYFHPPDHISPGIHPSAVIGSHVRLGKNLTIEAGVVIADDSVIGDNVHLLPNVVLGKSCVIGDHTIIKSNVSIMDGTMVGTHSIIHSGSVIGSDGFGFTQTDDTHQKIIHTGIVQIGDHVEIGACNTIDRGTLGKTIIGNGVKTDNQVHIAHNVQIGDHCLVVAQVGIAGSSTLGKNVIVAGKSGISGHLTIGDNTIIGPYSAVHSNVPENQIVSGIPHIEHSRWKKAVNIFSRLPELRKKLFAFEKRLKTIEKKVNINGE